jgi:hypothetical protein
MRFFFKLYYNKYAYVLVSVFKNNNNNNNNNQV